MSETKERDQAFIDECQATWEPVKAAIAERRNRMTQAVLVLLKKQFPRHTFDEDRISLQNPGDPYRISDYSEVATYQEDNMYRYTVYGTGYVERCATDLGRNYHGALFQVESGYYLCLINRKEDRRCELEVFFKRSGAWCRDLGYNVSRLTHTDSYGYEYIVIDDEKCYLQAVAGV